MADRLRPWLDEPKLTPQDEEAYGWWLWYYVRTEEFDRSLPGAPSRHDPDTWIPCDRATSSSYAKEIRLMALRNMIAAGVTEEIASRWKGIVERMRYHEQRRELERIERGPVEMILAEARQAAKKGGG